MSGHVHNPADVTELEAAVAAVQSDIDLLEIDVDAIREVTDSEAILTEIGGQLTTDGNVQNLYIAEAPAGIFRPICLKLDFSNHTAAETVVVGIEYRIAPSGAFILESSTTFAGVPVQLLQTFDLDPNRYGIKVTITKTEGTNRAYDWEVFYEEAP